jgi:hypothetical protein
MCSIRLRKQKVSSKNAAQIGLTCADHKGHRQSRQLHSTSKAAEDRRTPRRQRRIKLAVTAIPRLRESAAVFSRFGSGQNFYGSDKVSAGYRRSAGVATGARTYQTRHIGSFWSPVSLARANGTKGGNCSKRHDEEHDDGNFEENQYSIRDHPQSRTHRYLRHETEVPGYKNIDIFR